MTKQALKIIHRLAAAALLLSTLWFVLATLHWPLTGDAAMMHYVAFLSAHGLTPYRTIADINLPGSYLPDWIAQSLFGPAALPWRLYDYLLLAVTAFAMRQLARPPLRFAALWAACLFALIHGRDGLELTGERDLALSALLLLAIAALAVPSRRILPPLFAGLALGAALTIKPTAIFFLAVVPAAFILDRRTPDRNPAQRLALTLTGLLICPGLCAFWLAHHGATAAFLHTMLLLARYHASLGHAALPVLLARGIAPILPLVIVAAIILFLPQRRPASSTPHSRATVLLATGALAGALSYLVQAKAYPYQRYPLLACLLPLITLQLTQRLQSRTTQARAVSRIAFWLSLTALLWTALILAPISAWNAAHYEWPQQSVQRQLRADLTALAPAHRLSALAGRVQCLDTIGGCIDALEHLQLRQSTGLFYDEFLFQPANATAVTAERTRFAAAVLASPPQILIVYAWLFPSGPAGYAKLADWPAFNAWLLTHYTLAAENTPTQPIRSMGHAVLPLGYRIYKLREMPVVPHPPQPAVLSSNHVEHVHLQIKLP